MQESQERCAVDLAAVLRDQGEGALLQLVEAAFGVAPITTLRSPLRGRHVRVRSLRDGEVFATMVANEFVNAAESTVGAIKLNKLENLSTEPDTEWNNHPAEFVFKRDNVEYKHAVSWLNA